MFPPEIAKMLVDTENNPLLKVNNPSSLKDNNGAPDVAFQFDIFKANDEDELVFPTTDNGPCDRIPFEPTTSPVPT